MNINIIKNMLKEAIRGVFRHPMITFASVTTITLMLLVVGVFLAFTLNANHIIKRIGAEPPVQIWMRDGVEPLHLELLDAELKSNQLVTQYSMQTPQDNYDNYRETLGEDASLLDSLDPEKLPYSFTVQLIGPEAIGQFESVVETFPGISEVQYSQTVLNFFQESSRIINLASLISVAILLLVSLLIISNMVRISIFARAEEISIMKYVGATNHYIRVPYLLEGAFTGILGSIIAWGIVVFLYTRLYAWWMQDTQVGSAWALLGRPEIIIPVLLVLLITGGLVGAVGSAISVKKHVNV